jgi:hypothetical protein
MYPANRSGDCLCLHSEIGAPIFYATSSLNLSASVVRFLPFLMDGSVTHYFHNPYDH